MIDTTVLMKTAKGFDEIQSPTPSLPADLRMVLLMVNGLRNVAGLKVMNEELSRSIAPLVYLEDNGYIEPVPQRGQISLVPEEQMRAGGGGGSRRGFGVVPISPPPPPQPPQAREKEVSPAPKPSGLVRFFPQRSQPAPPPAAAPAPPPPTAPTTLRPLQPPAAPAPEPILRAAPPPTPIQPPRPAPQPVNQSYPQPLSPPPPPQQARTVTPPPPPIQQAAPPPQPYRPAAPPPPQAAVPPPPAPPAPSTGTALVMHGGGGVQNTERVRQLLRYMSRIMGPDAPPVLKKIQAVQSETELNIMVNRLVTIVRYYRGAVESEQFADHFGP